MTKNEMAAFFGYKDQKLFHYCFKDAEAECESIRNKKGHYNKNMEVDYTWEETEIALKYFGNHSILKDRGFGMTPAMKQVFKENFIHRDLPYKMKEKKIKLTSEQRSFIYLNLKNVSEFHTNLRCCASCAFCEARTMNRVGVKPSPYCNFNGCFLNKVLPRINIYKDHCELYQPIRKSPLIFTPDGVFSIQELTLKKVKDDMLGIPQSKFKSKRKRGEPITIIKDGFKDLY